MSKHHRYHFVPVHGDLGPGAIPLAGWKSSHPLHDRWTAADPRQPSATFSGRVLCRLRTETPLVVGAAHTERSGESTVVEPHRWGGAGGLPAIPASSLRGMISAVAEAASNSALRVLHPDESPKAGKPTPAPANFFEAVNPNLLSLGLGPRKTMLTLAELLFGFASDSDTFPGQKIALASRVRLSAALPDVTLAQADDLFLVKVPERLQAMRSPNRDSAAIYLQDPHNPSAWLSRKAARPGQHTPRGRKAYLRASHDDAFVAEPTSKPENHLCARPLKKGLEFFFHVDFDHLTRLEIGLLCYALRPREHFWHKLGLAKPFGLGAVSIGRVALLLTDRLRRYTADPLFDGPRYHWRWLSQQLPLEKWPAHFASDAARQGTAAELPPELHPATLAAEFRRLMESAAPGIVGALEQLGNPNNVAAGPGYLVPSTARRGLDPLSGNPDDTLPTY